MIKKTILAILLVIGIAIVIQLHSEEKATKAREIQQTENLKLAERYRINARTRKKTQDFLHTEAVKIKGLELIGLDKVRNAKDKGLAEVLLKSVEYERENETNRAIAQAEAILSRSFNKNIVRSMAIDIARSEGLLVADSVGIIERSENLHKAQYLNNAGQVENLHKVELIRVIDGDTVEVRYTTAVRLKDIDCFENKLNKRNKWQQSKYSKTEEEVIKSGLNSEKMLNNLIQVNKNNLYLQVDGLDKYKRILGNMYIGESKRINVNDYMLKNGGCMEYKPNLNR